MRRIAFIFLIVFSASFCYADWQSTLENHFDIVETFDPLTAWSGAGTDYQYSGLPTKVATKEPQWGHYMVSSIGGYDDQYPKWIDDHSANTWQRAFSATPKSLCIQYDYLYTTVDNAYLGQGAQRMGFYFGNGSGKSGYKDMYFFMMMKFAPGFFVQSGNGYIYEPSIKLIDFVTGFSNINTPVGNNICTDYAYQEYGTANMLTQAGGGGATYVAKQFPQLRPFRTVSSGGCYRYQEIGPYMATTANYGPRYEAGEWFGIEYRVDVGTLNNTDAVIEVWVYDDEGTEVGHYTSPTHNRLAVFDHWTNKVVIGGNRHSGNPPSAENRWWVDDIIINDTRIGPTYFSELATFDIDDTTAPEISTVAIGTNGTTFTVGFTETVVTTGSDDGDFNVDCATSGTNIALNSISGSGNSRTFTAASTIHRGDTCNLDYTGGANEIEDAAGNDLAAVNDKAVTNNSLANTAPNSTIDTPTENTTVTIGQTVNFTGTGTDADGDDMTYLWNFDGGSANSTSADPGATLFNPAGIYDVTFTVTDEFGLADSTPDTVQITVEAAAPPGLPQGGIGGPGAGVGADKPQMSVGVE